MKIGDNTVIPLAWFIVGVGSCFSIASAGSIWVYSVNERLSRIEEKLGIYPVHGTQLIEHASAEENKNEIKKAR